MPKVSEQLIEEYNKSLDIAIQLLKNSLIDKSVELKLKSLETIRKNTSKCIKALSEECNKKHNNILSNYLEGF